MRQVRWTGVQAGVPGGQRGHDSTQGIHRCARPCESGDTCVSSLVSFHLYQLKKRKRTWLFVFYASPVCRCTLSVAACVTSHVSVLCMCALGTRAQFCYCNRKVAVACLGLGRNLGPQAGAPVVRQEGALELLEEVVACNTPLT